jgi:hypothetical protein
MVLVYAPRPTNSTIRVLKEVGNPPVGGIFVSFFGMTTLIRVIPSLARRASVAKVTIKAADSSALQPLHVVSERPPGHLRKALQKIMLRSVAATFR